MLENIDVTGTFTINVHARVVMYMYLIFVMTEGVQFCISPTFIEPRAFIRHASMLTVAPTGAADMFANWCARHGRKSKVL